MPDVRSPIAHRAASAGCDERIPDVALFRTDDQRTSFPQRILDRHRIRDRHSDVRAMSVCGRGRAAARPAGSVLSFYPSEREHHPAFDRYWLKRVVGAAAMRADDRPSAGHADPGSHHDVTEEVTVIDKS